MPEMKDTEKKREMSLRHDTTVANVTSQQLWLPAWGLDKTEPINSQHGFMGLYCSRLNYWHLMASRGETVIIAFSCVPDREAKKKHKFFNKFSDSVDKFLWLGLGMSLALVEVSMAIPERMKTGST